MRTAMMTCEVKKGRSRETKGSRGPRRGSKTPQLGFSSATAAWRWSVAVAESEASFLPFFLPLRGPTPGLADGLVETAAVSAVVISLTYCV